jgi:hypothetical protein
LLTVLPIIEEDRHDLPKQSIWLDVPTINPVRYFKFLLPEEERPIVTGNTYSEMSTSYTTLKDEGVGLDFTFTHFFETDFVTEENTDYDSYSREDIDLDFLLKDI